MCSTYEDEEILPLKADKITSGPQKECMKCKTILAQVVIRVNDAFCRDCFIQYCTHKFRSAFGKSKIVRDGEKVLIAFSGGHASTAMLHLVMEGKSIRAQKKLRFVPGLVFVDDGVALGLSESSRKDTCVKIQKLFDGSQYPYHIVKLEQLFEDVTESGATPAERLKNMFDSVLSLTAKEQLIKTLRQQLILRVAKTEGYSKVIVGDTSTRLSVAILSNMAQGKGAHIPYDTSLLDDRDSELYIVRPMKDFTNKEIALYNMFFDLHPEIISTFTTKTATGASIDRLTESFVAGLQADFPSTVSTIMRTGDKLKNSKQSMAGRGDETQTMCLVCKAPLDTQVPLSSALESVRYSAALSEQRRRLHSPSDSSSNNSTSVDHAALSCYSCQQMLRDMPNPELLPPSVTSRTANRLAMKNYISENLLS